MLNTMTEATGKEIYMLAYFANYNCLTEIINKKKGISILNKPDAKYIDILTSIDMDDMNKSYDISNDIFGNLLNDNYKLYTEVVDMLSSKDLAVEQTLYKPLIDYVNFYERTLNTTKFEKDNIKHIQRIMLTKQLEKNIKLEQYEDCHILKQIIADI